MKKNHHLFSISILYLLLCFGLPAQSNEGNRSSKTVTQHALVVGIDQYQHADGFYFRNLEGAVNDAHILRDALRRAKINLPDKRILLNAKATRAAFVQAWQDMLKQAKQGDTLILSFSGHGGQQSDTAPFDEKDGKDETLIFHDFNPRHPTQGRIIDDELYGMFKEASAYNIVFVADSCHSSGMVRSMKKASGRFRSGGGFWNIKADAPPSLPRLPMRGDDGRKALVSHGPLITGVNSDSLQVPEATINNKQHGALSWFFAKALNGEADGNQNGFLERNELARFLREKIRDKMNNLQEPKLLPRADMVSVIKLATKPATSISHKKISDVTIVVENTSAPSGLKHVRIVKSFQSFDLRFVVKKRYTNIFNNTGDKITTLHGFTLNQWQSLIDKERLLKALETQFNMRLSPINITLREGDGLHKKGENLHFSITSGDKGLKALTLFNLASNGELQFLYPITEYGNSLNIRHFPYVPPRMQVMPPFGGDDLVVLLCKRPAKSLHYLLKKKQPSIPAFKQILSQLRGNTCQVGQYAFFSGK